jgi:hypothetical protein
MWSVGWALRERFCSIEMVFRLVAVRERSSSAARWMKVWPSSQKGRTNFSTLQQLVDLLKMT